MKHSSLWIDVRGCKGKRAKHSKYDESILDVSSTTNRAANRSSRCLLNVSHEAWAPNGSSGIQNPPPDVGWRASRNKLIENASPVVWRHSPDDEWPLAAAVGRASTLARHPNVSAKCQPRYSQGTSIPAMITRLGWFSRRAAGSL